MTKKEFIKIFKRFFLAFLCCIPFYILIGVFLREKIGNVWTVVIYVFLGAGAFVLAEIINKKHEEKMELKRAKAKFKRRYKYLEKIEAEKTETETKVETSKKKKKSKKDEQTKE